MAIIPPAQSTAQTVEESQQARVSNANTQIPEQSAEPGATTAIPQNTNPPNTAEAQDSIGARASDQYQAAQAGQGVATDTTIDNSRRQNAVNDDQTENVASSAPGTVSSGPIPVAQEFLQRITPRPNGLSRFASMSYVISIYLMRPEEYKKLLFDKKKQIPGSLLLMQSGGAPAESRNQFFPLDYYIDDVKMTSAISTSAVGSAHNVTELEFKISEPYGISFLDNLKKAVDAYVSSQQPPQDVQEAQQIADGNSNPPKINVNYAAQNYLMVIKFYGYDDQGNLTSSSDFDNSERNDPKALYEKFIPFQFSEIKFRISNKMVEYQCKAAVPQVAVAYSAARASIPFNVELVAEDLKGLLGGQAVFQATQETQTTARSTADVASPSTPNVGSEWQVDPTGELEFVGSPTPNTVTSPSSPPKASATPTKTLVSGLMDALNQRLKEEAAKRGEIPDEYQVKFEEGSGLPDAKLIRPGSTNKKRTGMISGQQAAQALLDKKQNVKRNQRAYSITAGTQIVQFIDIAVRTSSYITDQQNWYYDELTGDILPQDNPNKVMQWYKIVTQVEPLQYDPKKNDFAYRITYVIKRYQVNDLKSEYFPRAPFRGTHKRYDYWFTGQNSEVVDFEQDFNFLYFVTISGAPTPALAMASNARELEKRYFTARSGQTGQGGENKSTEPASNAASILYSPADQGRCRVKILGDPDYIQQCEVFYGDKISNGAFLLDGSINYDAQEVLFEINFNTAQDYENNGLMNVYKNNYLADPSRGLSGGGVNSFVYRANVIHNLFSRGKFTQEIEGTLMTFPDKEQLEKSKNPSAPVVRNQSTRNATTPIPPVALPPAPINFQDQVGGSIGAFLGYDVTSVEDLPQVDRSNATLINPTNESTAETQRLARAAATPPVSNGAPAAVANPNVSASTGGVNVQAVNTTVNLTSGSSRQVYTDEQVDLLLASGAIDARTARSAKLELQAKTVAQQPQVQTRANDTVREY